MAVKITVYGQANMAQITRARGELNRLEAQTKTNATGFAGSMARMSASAETQGAKIAKSGKSMSMNLTLPIVGIGIAAAKMSIDFDSSMTKIVALVGLTKTEVDGMRVSVLKLAGDTGKAPLELSDALFVVTSAGLKGKAALDALDASARASAAGLGETKDIARAVAGSVNAYGAANLSAAAATDAIVATARAGNFETSEFAGALGRVLPMSAQVGASLQDTGGAVALLTRTNGDAAQSITQMSALFRAFAIPTSQTATLLKSVGLSASDMRRSISTDGLPAALQMLDTKLGGNREKLGLLLGSSEGASAAFQILNADTKTLGETFGVVNTSAGMTAAAFADTADSKGFKLNKAINAIKASLIGLGDTLGPQVEGLAGVFTKLSDAFASLTPAQRSVLVNFGMVLAVIGPVLLIGGKLISAFGQVSGAMVKVSSGVLNLSKGLLGIGANAEGGMTGLTKFGAALRSGVVSGAQMAVSLYETSFLLALQAWDWIKATASMVAHKVASAAVAVATGIMTAAQWALNAAMTANPIGLVVVAIVALVGVFVLAYNKIDWFRNFVNLAFTAIKNVISGVVSWVSTNWPLLLTILTGPIGLAVAFIVTHWDTIKAKTAAVFNAVKSTFSDVVAAVVGFGRSVGNFVLGVGEKIGEVIAFFTGLPGKVLAVYAGAGKWLLETGKNIVQGLLDGAGSLLSKIGQFFLDKLPGWIVAPFKAALGIESPSKVFHGFGKNIGEGLINGTISKTAAVKQAGQALAKAMKAGTKNALSDAIKGATDVSGSLSDSYSKMQDYFNRMVDIVSASFDSLKQRAQSSIDDLTGKLDGLKNDAASFASSIAGSFSVAFDSTGTGSVLDSFRAGISDGQAFVAQIQQLREFGLNETSLNNIIGAGVAQGKIIADSLLKDGAGGIGEVNALQAAFDSQVSALTQSMTQEQFGAKIAQAQSALVNAQNAYAEIVTQEQNQLDWIKSLGTQFGLNADIMTVTLDGSQKQLDTMLNSQDVATNILTDSVTAVTQGLLATAATMAAEATKLKADITSLNTRINAAQSKLDGIGDKTPAKKATGGAVVAGTPYIVGDGGVPELFVPSQNGTILPKVPTFSATPMNSGSGTTVTIAPGAVQVTVTGGGDAQAVTDAVNEAFAGLVRQLRAN